MALIERTKNSKGVHLWETLTATDTGAPLEVANRGGAMGSVQMTGTFGGTVTMQVSNDGTNWVTMKDLQGAEIALTAAGMADFTSGARYIRPSAGSGVSDVDVRLYLGN